MAQSEELNLLRTELFGNTSEPPKKKLKLSHKKKKSKDSKPAWTDPEDSTIKINVHKNRKLRHLRQDFNESELNAKEYINRQRKHFKQSMDDDWTKEAEKTQSESDSDIKHDTKGNQSNKLQIHTSVRITARETLSIPKNKIALSDIGSVNSAHSHQSVITVCDFDKTGKLLMTAGLDKTLCLYSMEGKNNELLKRIFIQDMPIRCAKYSFDGKEIIITGRRYFIYVFNLINFKIQRINKLLGRDERSWEYFEVSPNGKHLIFVGIRGCMIVVSAKTKKPIKTLQISDAIAMIKFNYNGQKMYVLTQNGIVYVFDMARFRCIDKVMFDGIVKATSFDVCAQLNIVAIGCNSGVVTVYYYRFDKGESKVLMDRKGLSVESESENGSVKAIYSVNNLLTCITGIEFNFDGQLMVIWSKNKKQSVRLVHVESGKVFANWPKDKGLSYVYRAKFSPKSGYLAVGNDHGYVKLIRLHFYGAL